MVNSEIVLPAQKQYIPKEGDIIEIRDNVINTNWYGAEVTRVEHGDLHCHVLVNSLFAPTVVVSVNEYGKRWRYASVKYD